jgi:hypothetical protein
MQGPFAAKPDRILGSDAIMEDIEQRAVNAALADFAQFQLALDIGEESQEMTQQLNDALATKDSELAGVAAETITRARSEFDQYLYAEQSALVEGLVRAYARRRLRPLLEQYEVLEVEREGSWCLAEKSYRDMETRVDIEEQIWFMSRPDALLRERESNQLYILSFKTAAKWDRRKAEDAKRDMQGLSEGVEVEKRLNEWWAGAQTQPLEPWQWGKESPSAEMWKFLRSCVAPPRIMGIRYEYLLKGDRWTDKELSAKLGVEVRSQRSPLVRAYHNPGMMAGDDQFNVAWDYVKETGEPSKLYYKNWKSAPVFEHIPVKDWITMLDESVMTMGEDGTTERGWSSKAQVTGYLEEHPLDAIFIPPIIVYRNDDELRDWIEQVESQEVRVAEGVARVAAASDEGEKRHLLNVLFPMTRRACEYPTTCSCVKICYGGEEIRRDPLGSGEYKKREPHHQPEKEGAA